MSASHAGGPRAVDPIRDKDGDLVCVDVVELVTAYIEGELDPKTAAAVERHLADCPKCQTYLQQMGETVRRLGRLPAITISAEVRAELARAFAEYTARSSRG